MKMLRATTTAATALRGGAWRPARAHSACVLPPACVLRCAQRSMMFSTSDVGSPDDEDKYLELLQLRDIKSEEFYDEHAQERRYFYYIDLQGRLFLENTRPKNIATSLKSAKFLKFFFSQLRPNDASSSSPSAPSPLPPPLFPEYPYRSPCGKEMNFIKCADRPFVFEDFRERHDNSDDGGTWVFTYGGGELTAPFSPDKLKISLSTGRLYHDIPTKYAAPAGPTRTAGAGAGADTGSSRHAIAIALIKSQLAVEFGRHIDVFDAPVAALSSEDARLDVDSDDAGLIIGEFAWRGQRYPIHAIE